ncbi:uncharacterized protein METZ01_LOCUS328158, partial [marine metagenome]
AEEPNFQQELDQGTSGQQEMDIPAPEAVTEPEAVPEAPAPETTDDTVTRLYGKNRYTVVIPLDDGPVEVTVVAEFMYLGQKFIVHRPVDDPKGKQNKWIVSEVTTLLKVNPPANTSLGRKAETSISRVIQAVKERLDTVGAEKLAEVVAKNEAAPEAVPEAPAPETLQEEYDSTQQEEYKAEAERAEVEAAIEERQAEAEAAIDQDFDDPADFYDSTTEADARAEAELAEIEAEVEERAEAEGKLDVERPRIDPENMTQEEVDQALEEVYAVIQEIITSSNYGIDSPAVVGFIDALLEAVGFKKPPYILSETLARELLEKAEKNALFPRQIFEELRDGLAV